MDGAEGTFEGISAAISVAPTPGQTASVARLVTRALRTMDEAEVSRAVDERIAAARLGVSVDMLRYDRRTGKLGIPYAKLGPGKRGLVRYDVDDLDAWVESKKRVGKRPIAEVQAPASPVMPALPPVEPFEVEEPVERIDPPMPVRRSPPRTPWEAMAERYAEEPEEDPFATGRPGRRQPGRYWTGV